MKPTTPTLSQNNGRYLQDESGQQKTRHNMAANLKRGLPLKGGDKYSNFFVEAKFFSLRQLQLIPFRTACHVDVNRKKRSQNLETKLPKISAQKFL